jgi:hypothetical protein
MEVEAIVAITEDYKGHRSADWKRVKGEKYRLRRRGILFQSRISLPREIIAHPSRSRRAFHRGAFLDLFDVTHIESRIDVLRYKRSKSSIVLRKMSKSRQSIPMVYKNPRYRLAVALANAPSSHCRYNLYDL